MIAERIQELLEEGISVDYFDGTDRPELTAYLGNLKAHRCRLDAVEANVVLALNRVDKQTTPSARPSDNADDLAKETGDSKAETFGPPRWPRHSISTDPGVKSLRD